MGEKVCGSRDRFQPALPYCFVFIYLFILGGVFPNISSKLSA